MIKQLQLEYGLFWLLFGLALIVFVVLIHSYILYREYSGLSEVPAASRLAPLTGLWITWNRFRGKEFRTVEAAFRKCGPIVRLGPKELAINVIDGGIRTVHGQGYHKTDWYSHFINYGQRNTISTVGSTHGPVRRRISHLYSKSYIQRCPDFRAMLSTVLEGRLLPILSYHEASNRPVDMLELSISYGMDMVMAFTFGLRNGTNLLQDTNSRKWFLDTFSNYLGKGHQFWLNNVPKLTSYLAGLGLDPVHQDYRQARSDIEAWCLSLVCGAEESLNSETSNDKRIPGEKPVVFQQLWHSVQQEAKSRNETSLSPYEQRREVASEFMDHIMATREDFGITLSSVFHQISRHPECQRKLQQELRGLGTTELPSAQALEALPYFNATIKECLRLRPTPPSPSPRVTPAGPPSSLGPYTNIPAGTTVIAFSRSLHRNECVFRVPEAFTPERWLRASHVDSGYQAEEQNKRVAECERWFWTFSSGRRMCLASHMTFEMIRMILATVYLRFSTSVEDDSSYGIHDGFVEGLGERLWLNVDRIKDMKSCNATAESETVR